MPAVLTVENLRVEFKQRGISLTAVREASLEVFQSECLAVVGESGSGKTQLFLAAMGLLPRSATASGSVRFESQELLGADTATLNRLRGSQLAMIFQDPMTALTPHLKIGEQLAEALVAHRGNSWQQARAAALRMLERVAVPEPALRMTQYPHELSGGMKQRVLLGMSLMCEPRLVIADEPTTALDVTVQAQILDLLRKLRHEFGLSLVLISHDLAVVGGIADRIVVMYGGRVVERAAAAQLLHRPRHPYTAELLRCVPSMRGPIPPRMATLPGIPPRADEPEVGCAFAPRCPRAKEQCRSERPLLRAEGDAAACHFPLNA
jgi:oligopeptide transport system ATP-binding protein